MLNAEEMDKHSGYYGDLNPSVANCASKIMAEAVHKFISESEKHSKKSSNEEFIRKVSLANENLVVTIDHLMIVAHRFELGHSADNIKQALCQAARDVLQGVIKVLVVMDDFKVQGLLNKADEIITTVRAVNINEDYSEVKKKLAYLAVSVMSLRKMLFKRGQNLCSHTCRDQLTLWGNVLQSNIGLLHQVTKTWALYKTNVSAQASYDSVAQEIVQTCQKIKQLLTSGPEEAMDDSIMNFVGLVDKLINMLTEVEVGKLHEDTETNLVNIVQHSISVAHQCSSAVYKQMIMASCHRILQLKLRLFELNDEAKTLVPTFHKRTEFSKICETTLDEICHLEKHVTLAVLSLIIEIFLCPEEYVIKLRKMASSQIAGLSDEIQKYVQEFVGYTEEICQVSLLVASSSSDRARVRKILTAVKSLESAEAEVTPAVYIKVKNSKNRTSSKQYELVLNRWTQEVKTLVEVIDKLVDPKVFIEMTESLLHKEVERFKSLQGASYDELLSHSYRIRNLVNRTKNVTEKLLEESSDPIYRNGLRCFIKKLTESMLDAGTVYTELIQSREPNSQQHDTVDRRLHIVLQAVRSLKEGLDVSKHPHIMSKERLMFHTRDSHLQEKSSKAKKELKHDSKSTKLSADHAVQTDVADANIHKPRTDEKVFDKQHKVHQENKELPLELTSRADLNQAINPASVAVSKQSKNHLTETTPDILLPEIFKEKEREGGPASECYGLVKTFLIACLSRDQRSMQDSNYSLLSWTHHIIESAEAVAKHCSTLPNISELSQLAKELDVTSTEVLYRAKYVAAGDVSLVRELFVTSVLWAQQLTRARLIVDVTADFFMAMSSVLYSDVQHSYLGDKHHQLDTMENSQKEVLVLLKNVKTLSTKCVPSEKLEFVTQVPNELENVMATIKTFLDTAVITAETSDAHWQLRMACCDWSILMTCAVSECEDISSRTEKLGQLKFSCLETYSVKDRFKTWSILESETDVLLELIDCVVCRDSFLKENSESLVLELQNALLLTKTLAENADNDTALLKYFGTLKFRVAISIWIDRALDVKLFLRNNCSDYMGFVRYISSAAQTISKYEDVSEDVKIKNKSLLCNQLLEQSSALKQKVLKILQLSPDLNRRAVIRSTLDDLSKLTTQIDHVLREKPTITEADVDHFSELWGAKMKKLLVNMKKLDGLNHTAITDIENLNNKLISRDLKQIEKQIPASSPRQSHEPSNQHNWSQHSHTINVPSISYPPTERSDPSNYVHSLAPHQQFTSAVPPHHSSVQFRFPPPVTPSKALQDMHPAAVAHSETSFSIQSPALTSAVKSPCQYLQKPPVVSQNSPTSLTSELTPDLGVPYKSHQLEVIDHTRYPVHTTHSTVDVATGPQAIISKSTKKNVDTSSPFDKSVNVLLKDAQYLDVCLHKWHDKMIHFETGEKSTVVQDALEMARLCTEMALYTKGQGSFKDSSEVITAAFSIVQCSQKIEVFANRLHTLAGQCWLSDHLKMCILKMNGCTSQLQIISTALHNSHKSHQGDRILVRNASNLLTTVRQIFALVESIAAMGLQLPSDSDELTKQIISLLAQIHLANETYLKEQRKTSHLDELGLRRVELHNPPTLTSSMKD